ncbi:MULTISPECIES: hypothetical protein [Idiomarina]|jgi:amino acid transporter|uniref:Zn-ribbon protein n=3 Tax=Idiomarinaceae TaxID=267893 RepID=A0A8I1KGX1_9GAMM|nr:MULTISPECIES: hypothetical protein [Idiomarina]KPD22650.1 Zn-ribbon protein [Idiomarina abyssalis]MAO66834.1 hypothetical protein [Idiomarina sp.]MBE93214.1 hypothetical protein [Idiomarina sp.]MBF79983.1 hypothetical protein [Idiomarina sp.]MBH95324.1 hypothetical protein [Idiomarina sp.]|tara:strand:+ start:7059 stop:7388 length:330 start_codon:yes stop_codon:yes gene_type:complete
MALTQCPSCNKRISSKVKECPHCQFVLAGQSKEDMEREWLRLKQEKSDKLVSRSMLALLIAIAAFTYLFMQQPMPNTWQYGIAVGAMVGGVVWFLINRVQLLFLKKKKR